MRLELTDLVEMLSKCAGTAEWADLDGDIMDTLFLDLGYDSLAILQATGWIERDYHITFDEEAIDLAETPRQYLELANELLAARAAA
ncbi:phosphopantetheine-binding protein [Streptomyces monticola]|uniref:Phosphopantetheine-binding protein n=1 Tax=Streptomyces monticola TaxID=2666263 RepID=A0ABW2JXM2_9ACTN